jgi:SAM-dependent methyltransferase
MPVIPPSLLEPPRFNPIFLTDDDLDDLASFTGMTPAECRDRVESYSHAEHAEAWRRANPRTPTEVLDFYRSTDLYVWELVQWHASEERTPLWQALATFVERFPPDAGYRRVYDFGCGIGTDGLFLADRGYDVTFVDVDGPTFRFAKHRVERRELPAQFVESRSPLPEPDGTYDAIICFDVFEHLLDPLAAAKRLVGALRPGGVLVQRGSFDSEGDHPCHLGENVRRFAGLRWDIHLARLGLRSEGSHMHRKVQGWERAVQRLRHEFWRLTGLWLIHLPKEQ